MINFGGANRSKKVCQEDWWREEICREKTNFPRGSCCTNLQDFLWEVLVIFLDDGRLVAFLCELRRQFVDVHQTIEKIEKRKKQILVKMMFQKIFHQLRTLMRMRTMVKFSCSVSDATRVRLYCSRAGEEASLINKTVRKFEHRPERERPFSVRPFLVRPFLLTLSGRIICQCTSSGNLLTLNFGNFKIVAKSPRKS